MFANKGRLKVALLVIGFLVASLGMYAGFQIEKAEATHSNSLSCPLKLHTFGSLTSIVTLTPTSTYTTFQGNCSSCGWNAPEKTHKYRKYFRVYYYSRPFFHKYPWEASYGFCHYHTSQSYDYVWRTEPCGG